LRRYWQRADTAWAWCQAQAVRIGLRIATRVRAREFTGAIGPPKDDAGSHGNHKKDGRTTAVDGKREVVVVLVSDVDRVGVSSHVLESPTDIDGGRQLLSGG
jgi:hypothetical protein